MMNEEPSHAADQAAVPCVWVYVPLPEPLPIPHESEFETPQDPLVLFERKADGIAASPLASSALVLQVPRANDPLEALLTDLIAGALDGKHKHFPATGGVEPSAPAAVDSATTGAVLTVVEVAFPGGDRPLDELLDEAIDTARIIQQGVAHITGAPVRVVNRRRLSPFLPIIHGHIHFGGSLPTYDRAEMMRVNHSAPPGDYSVRPTDLEPSQLKWLEHAINEAALRTSQAQFADLRRDALVQLRSDGNTRLAVVTTATAGEVLISTLALQLAWEERCDPYEVATAYEPRLDHSKRFARDLVPRLGGNWDRNGNGAVGVYFRELVHLRHRAVHAGHEPTVDEAEAALAALDGLVSFIGDRLCDPKNLNRYTRTANALIGRRGIERRDRWTRRVADLTEDPEQPNWSENFRRWRAHFEIGLDEVPPASSALADLWVVVDAPDGELRVRVWDPATLQGAHIDDPLRFAGGPSAEIVAAVLAGAAGRTPVRLLDHGLNERPETWQPDYDVFEDLRIDPGD
jgi:hypothetical protein